MQDQVRSLNDSGIRSAYINSSLTERQMSKALELASNGEYKIIYVAPERLENYEFRMFAQYANISMVAVDEAHCISQWGQDFRPSYLKITEFIRSLPKRPVVGAFTATATGEVKDDICCVLGLADPDVYVTGYDRPNLYFEVDTVKDKNKYVINYINAHPGDSGIIYCATRKNTDELFDFLCENGVKAAKYHAGIGNNDRKEYQNRFITDELPVIVATNAFGMGIDKSNVRFVIHYNMPQSMENYYQEAGRAGRDGEPANCILLFSSQDVMIDRFLLEKKSFEDIPEENIDNIRERDMLRLRRMEGYCKTTGCLRSYILGYFEETELKKCDNCGNCLKEYSEEEVTAEAKKIFNCIYETRSRYGASTISAILAGANRARLREIGAVALRSYGALSHLTERKIRSIISDLLNDKYLVITNSEYNIIGLSDKISDFKNPEFRYTVKVIQDKKEKTVPVRTQNSYLTSLGFELYDKLRALRLDIAQRNSIPPYVVFSDRTLTDMCVKLPATKDEMLDVSGVAAIKYQKYGEEFLAAVTGFVGSHPGQIISEYDKSADTNAVMKAKKQGKKIKEAFYLTSEELEKVEYSEYAFVSEIRDRINSVGNSENMKKLSYNEISQFLIEKGYIELTEIDGEQKKIPTEKGRANGMIEIERVSEKTGQTYKRIMYPEQIQREIASRFVRVRSSDITE